ncbi:IQ domain-containing protein K [Passer montanus]|uniref:IQ domain-containing protein K n=1 Tax=Passer montanus TaxID=9160 RepID=UPI00195FC837|nr:IQ domain-containing protein K [Passer montanus]
MKVAARPAQPPQAVCPGPPRPPTAGTGEAGGGSPRPAALRTPARHGTARHAPSPPRRAPALPPRRPSGRPCPLLSRPPHRAPKPAPIPTGTSAPGGSARGPHGAVTAVISRQTPSVCVVPQPGCCQRGGASELPWALRRACNGPGTDRGRQRGGCCKAERAALQLCSSTALSPFSTSHAQSRRFALKWPFSEHEEEQPQFSDVPQSKQDPESKEESVPLEAEIPVEELFSPPADQYLLSALGETPPGEPPDPKKCSTREYLEFYIFPVLLPGLAALLQEAEKEKCFEEKRTKFIPSDFLTEWLYNKNPKRKDESFTELFSIPFVKDWLKDHPRPPVPLSLLLSEEEASILIQSFWRGYRVRCDSEVQELRRWQKKLREERYINEVVRKFWAKQEAKVRSKSEELDKQNPSTSQF